MKRSMWPTAVCAILWTVLPVYAGEASLDAHVQALRTGGEKERMEAALALFDLGPQAKPAVPALADALYAPQTEIKLVALAALTRLGPDAVAAAPALASRLDDPEEGVRSAAMAALESLGPDAAPALAQVARNGSSFARSNAAELLQSLDVEATPRIPVLVAGLREEDFSTHASRARGPLEHASVAELIRKLKAGEDDNTTYHAISSLGRKGPDALPAISHLARAVRNMEVASDVRLIAAWAIGQIGPQAKPAENLLLSAMDTETHKAVLPHIAQALGKIGADSQATVDALIGGLSSEDSQLRGACAISLARIGNHLGSKRSAAVTPLMTMLGGTGLEPYMAVLALGAIGEEAAPAVPQLIPLLDNQYPSMREAAAYALGRIGPAAATAIPALRASAERTSDSSKAPDARSKDNAAREAAARAIARIERTQVSAAE